MPNEGPLVRFKGVNRPSYAAVSASKFVAAAGTGVFGSLYGSAAKNTVIEVNKIIVSAAVANAAVYGDLIVTKRTAAIGSDGTSTTITPTPINGANTTASGATNVKSFTAAPTAGTGGGVVAGTLAFVPLLGTPASSNAPWMFEFGLHDEQETLQLRGAAQGIELSWATTLGNAATTMFSIEYSEWQEV